MMVAGKLEARGRSTKEIKFVLNEEQNDVLLSDYYNDTGAEIPSTPEDISVRLVGGQTPLEGRLQVH